MNRLRSIFLLFVALGVFFPRGVRAAESALPPPLPLPTSPVTVFRQMLALGPDERAAELARRPSAQRDALRDRLTEYDALPPGPREDRLRATDLYWHVQQLLPLASAERADLLATAPAELRPILIERLALWDRLPEADRATLLQHERAIGYFAQFRAPVPPPLPGSPASAQARASVPSTSEVALPLRLQSELGRLQDLPVGERRRLVETWRQFFEAPPTSHQRSLQAMSAEEREEMERVVRRFRAMPAHQRLVCIESFARFATMPAAERSGFLRSAANWESLPAEERAAWRRVVTKLPQLPPLPTEFTPPPLPPAARRGRLLTNGSVPALAP